MNLCKKIQQNISLLRKALVKAETKRNPFLSFPIFFKLYFFVFFRAFLRAYAFLFDDDHKYFFVLTGTKKRQFYFTTSPYCSYKRVRKQTVGFGRAALVVIIIASVIGSSTLYFLMDILRPGKSTFPTEAAATPWYNASWLYRKQITIDHTKVADVATPSATYANFPVLISLDALSNINANGTDIRFTSSDGVTELPREIESYSSGSLRAWVKTTLTKDASDSTDDIIYMYYGNAAATEPAANSSYGSQNVWKTDGVDTSNVMTQHMKDTTTSTITDSTANANNGTKVAANSPIETTGQIGKAQSFNGTTDYVDASNGASLNITNAITIEAWINPKNKTIIQPIITKRNLNVVSPYFVGIDSTGKYYLAYANGSGTWYNSTIGTVDLNVWQHIVFTRNSDGTLINFYKNGVNVLVNDIGIGIAVGNALPLRIANANDGYSPFNGSLDEARIYNRALSAQEITTQYNNQNSPSTFYTPGIEEKPLLSA